MLVSREKFEEMVARTLDGLPEKFKERINNVAMFVEDYPTDEQLKKVRLRGKNSLFGLFEGYAQARKLNFGPVLPDRITIFRKPICQACGTEEECVRQIESTVKHEIAHHFGSDEKGAAKAGKRKP
jgi:predicted Zn-dependent protease with MMP-like domain